MTKPDEKLEQAEEDEQFANSEKADWEILDDLAKEYARTTNNSHPAVAYKAGFKAAAYERERKDERVAKLVEALNRIVGMVETWTNEHGQRKTEEIYASKIAREALKEFEGGK